MLPFIEKKVGPDCMVYDPTKDAVHILNASSQRVLQLARQGLNAADIADVLRSEFQLSTDHPVLEQVQENLRHLVSLGLLTDPK